MTFSITLGWWLAPAVVSFLAYGWHRWVHWGEEKSYGYASAGSAIWELLTLLVAFTVSLISWLLWALLVR